MLPEVSRFYAELGQNLKLFDKYKALRASARIRDAEPSSSKRSSTTKSAISACPAPNCRKTRSRASRPSSEELSQLSAKFSENLLDATNAFAEIVTDEAQLAGLPDDAIQAAQEPQPRRPASTGWRFSLQAPSYGPVMQYADNRELRARMYRAYATRAAEFHDGSEQAGMGQHAGHQRMLELRQEEAKMLGFDNFAEVSLAPKMADTPAQVLAFLRELAAKAKPFAAKDIAELRAFARDELGIADFAALGCRPTLRKSCCRSAMPSPSRK